MVDPCPDYSLGSRPELCLSGPAEAPHKGPAFGRAGLRLAICGLLAFCAPACEKGSKGGEGVSTSSTAGGSHDSNHDSHDHGSHGDHDHGSGVGTLPNGGNNTGFDPMGVGSAPPAPGPRDCSKLVSTGIKEGDVAPDVTVQNSLGQEVRLHDYCNHTVLLLCGVMS